MYKRQDKWQGILEQTSKRGAANIYRLPDYIETRDLETLWTYYGSPTPSRAMLATLKQQANLYGFGKTTKRLRKGLDVYKRQAPSTARTTSGGYAGRGCHC